MTDWPLASLPATPLDGSFSETPIPAYIDDPSDVGAPRRRARFTRTLRQFSFGYMLTTAQKNALEAFFYTTLDGGVSSFNWTHPDTAVVYSVRFARDGMKISHRTGADSVGDYWNADIKIEEI